MFIALVLFFCMIFASNIENKDNSTGNACLSRLSLQSVSHLFEKTDLKTAIDEPEQLNWSTNDWILQHNYTLELHYVVTLDGYNLTLHRLPRPGHRPILLVHGLLTSSLAWVIMGPAKSLAFQLFNNYYDVWLANMRGSSWSRNHSHLNVENSDFWSYSFHEWGRYDLPAIVDHIRNESSFQQVLLIGHSQALNAVLVMCSLLPQYNKRLQFVQALAPPVALKSHVKFNSADVKNVMKFLKIKAKSKEFELLPRKFMLAKCLQSTKQNMCAALLDLFAGNGQQNRLSNDLLFGQLLQGGCLKEVYHLHQIWRSGDFVAYDYEPKTNLLVYNSVTPLIYDLKMVTVPILLYFGETDALASPEGVNQLYAHLLGSVKGVLRIAADQFNHMDFLISTKVKKLVNNRLLADLEKFLRTQLKYVID